MFGRSAVAVLGVVGAVVGLAVPAAAHVSTGAFGTVGGLGGQDLLLGYVARAAGDVNGDGKADTVTSNPAASTGGRNQNGLVLVQLGESGGSTGPAAVTASDGFFIRGPEDGSMVATESAGGGDLDGDGYGDLLLRDLQGVDGANDVWVVFGSAAPVDVDLATAPSTVAVQLQGAAVGGCSLRALTWADLDGDGFDDAVISADEVEVPGRTVPVTIVVWGSASRAALDLGSPPAGAVTRLRGPAPDTRPGPVVAGDVDGDDHLDLAIVTEGMTDGTTTWNRIDVVAGPIAGDVDLAVTPGDVVYDLATADTVALAAGDVDGDGVDDLAVATQLAGPTHVGETYVVPGGTMASGPLGAATAGVHVVLGSASGYANPNPQVEVADLDADGDAELVVSGPGDSAPGGLYAGKVYVLLGGAAFAGRHLDDPLGSAGAVVDGGAYGVGAGGVMDAVGDTDGDGFGDLLVGAAGHYDPVTEQFIGAQFLVYGAATIGNDTLAAVGGP